jgi:septum site-determining protein MinD
MRYIAIASAKGGVGKTTTAINIATALHLFGRSIVLVDANFSKPNVGLHLGTPSVKLGIHDVMAKGKNIRDAVHLHPSGLKVVPADISLFKHKINYKNFADKLFDLDGYTEAVIIDTSNGLHEEAIETLKGATEIIIVTEPNSTSVTDALKTIHLIEDQGGFIAGVIITKFRGDNFDMSIDNVKTLLSKPILGVIPFDDAIRKSIAVKHPVNFSHPNSPSALAYKKLAADIIGHSYAEPEKANTKKSFLERIMKNA